LGCTDLQTLDELVNPTNQSRFRLESCAGDEAW